MNFKRNIIYKMLALLAFAITMSYASDGGPNFTIDNISGNGGRYVCIGYGDGLNVTYDYGRPYFEGFTYEPKSQCGNGGCFINCLDNTGTGGITVMHFTNRIYPNTVYPEINKQIFVFNGRTQQGVIRRELYVCQRNSCTPFGIGGAIGCNTCFKSTLIKRGDSSGGGSNPNPNPPTPPTPIDLIVEEINFLGSKPQNLVYTKTSGSRIEVRVYHKDSTGSIGSGLNSASCVVKREGKTTASGKGTYNMWSGGGAFEWKYNGAIPTTGTYTIQCSGEAKNGATAESPEILFNVVPASYDVKADIVSKNNNRYTINSGTLKSDGGTKKATLSGVKFPIMKTEDGTLEVRLSGQANTVSYSTDSGVNSSIVTKNFVNNAKGWNNANTGSNICKVAPPNPTNSNVKLSRGSFNNALANKVVFNDVYSGTITVQYVDEEITKIVESERLAGRCSGKGTSNGQCPYPPTFEYSFPYLVVPHNFSIDIKTAQSNDSVKVLYYGQGSTPESEIPNILKVVAEDSNNNALKNYVNGCAALDVDLELNTISGDVYITFIDPNNPVNTNVTTIKASDFLSGTNSEANISRVISVKKKDGAFLPSEVDEPMFLNVGFNRLMYFTGQKNNNDYPKYTPRFNLANDMVILRGRINSIDTDNAQDYTKMPTTIVNYEFYCKTCSLDAVRAITGANQYTPSPTEQGWWIDSTFNKFNASSVKIANISTTNNIKVNSISQVKDGVQTISYNNASAGKYQVKINQNQTSSAFPSFLLYNPYYDASIVNWGTSSFVTIYGKVQHDTSRDFGVDTGDSKNTRSGGRTGGF